MKIGVTGTRSGMNERQRTEFIAFLTEIGTGEFHHGDCVGVDVEAAEIAKSLGFKIVCHPPVKTDLRAYHKSDEFRQPDSYLARNRNIVNETDMLIVVPYQNERQDRGGTWYTYDYAVKKGRPFHVIFPNNS